MKKYWPCLITGVIFFLIEFASPLAGDDYIFILNSEKNILEIVSQLYMTWSGRFLSNALIIFVANKPILWLALSTLLFTGISWAMIRIAKVESLMGKLLVLLCIFGVSTAVRMETYSWMTGIVFYMIPLAAALIYVYICIQTVIEKNREIKNHDRLVMILCCFITGLMMENIAAGMVVFNVLLMLYTWINEKRVFKIHGLCALIATAGFLSVTLSPGNAVRAVEYVEFNQLSLFGKIFANFPVVLKFTYLDNRLLIFLLSAVLIVRLMKSKTASLIKIGLGLFLSVAILTSFAESVRFFMDSEWIPYISAIYSLFYRLMDPNSLTTQLYWILFTIYFLVVLLKNKAWKLLILALFAYACNAAMLLAPIVGGRTSVYTLYFFYCVTLLMIKEIHFKKTAEMALIVLIAISVGYNLLEYGKIYSNVYRIKQQQMESVADYCNSRDCPDDYDYQVKLEPYPNNSIHTGNMLGGMHEKAFKQYYDITDWVLLNYDMETW